MTTDNIAPPMGATEADTILQELAAVGVDPSSDERENLEQHIINDPSPRTQVVQGEGIVPEFSEGNEESIITGQQAPGLNSNFTPPTTLTVVSDPGWITVYNRFTGDPSVCNVNMLPAQLRKRDMDTKSKNHSKLVFTTTDPGFRPKAGTGKCWLHPEGLFRLLGDEWGMEVCTKSNLTSVYNIRMHVRNKHRNEYEQLEENRLEAERQEDREERRLILRSLATQQESRAAAEGDVNIEVGNVETVRIDEEPDYDPDSMSELEVWNAQFKDAEETGICPVAGEDCFSSTANLKKTRRSNLDRHRKEKHPETK